MNLKQKAKTYSFWISLVSAILIIVRVICTHFNLTINESFIMDVVTGICGVLVLLGILTSPTQRKGEMEEITNNEVQKVEELNDTIKSDIQNKTLSIAEQIEMLTKKQETTKEEMQETEATFEEKKETPETEDAFEDKEESSEAEDASLVDNLVIVDGDVNLQKNTDFAENLLNLQSYEHEIAENVVIENDVTEASLENKEDTLFNAVAENITEKNAEIYNPITTQTTEQTVTTNVEKELPKLTIEELKELLLEVINKL